MTYYPGGPFIGEPGEDERFEKFREDFLLDFKEGTARAYKADLEDFLEWCGSQGVDAVLFSLDRLAEYECSLGKRGYADSTQTRRVRTVRRFLEHVAAKRGTGS